MAGRDGLTILPREMSEVEIWLISDQNAERNPLMTRAFSLDGRWFLGCQARKATIAREKSIFATLAASRPAHAIRQLSPTCYRER